MAMSSWTRLSVIWAPICFESLAWRLSRVDIKFLSGLPGRSGFDQGAACRLQFSSIPQWFAVQLGDGQVHRCAILGEPGMTGSVLASVPIICEASGTPIDADDRPSPAGERSLHLMVSSGSCIDDAFRSERCEPFRERSPAGLGVGEAPRLIGWNNVCIKIEMSMPAWCGM